jgi:hypothetical protein
MDILLKAHEFAIYRTSFINGRYSYSTDKIYNTPGFHQVASGPNGPRGYDGYVGEIGCTGPTGARGCTGPRESLDENNYHVTSKSYKAFEIRCRPKENTKESYESLVLPVRDNYDDLGVSIEVRNPRSESVRRDLLPERASDVEKLNKVNSELDVFNRYVDRIFDRLNAGESVDFDQEQFDLCAENLEELKRKYTQIETTLNDFKEAEAKGERCYHGCCCEDDCSCTAPNSTRFHGYQKSIPYNWYAYERVVHYNDEPKLEIKCHEGTKLYQIIKNLLDSVL